ncbi:MAG: 3-phenylpropionate/cinnamic acid dioxygenase subunit beta [Pseudonocardia sp.]|nr:MAG: 3-phenylpropionate/cinnamic acid dioxygenase subunit beta [Pseudonocardia sp.]
MGSESNGAGAVVATETLTLLRQYEIEQFYYREAELLDDRQWRNWLNLLADDVRYFMPVRSNRTVRERDKETGTRSMVAHFDDDKRHMEWRVMQLESGTHWAEDPISRTRHMVTNVRIDEGDLPNEFVVRSNFLVYRNRMKRDVDVWAGERKDLLREVARGMYSIVDRTIVLDQTVVLAKNLSVFF